MTDILKFFDAYSVRAQVVPAAVAGLPVIFLVIALLPWDGWHFPHTVATVVGFALLFCAADLGRRLGRNIQNRLGTGTTPELWFRGDPTIPEIAKDRYRTFVAKKLQKPEPTAADEKGDPGRAIDFYLAAGTWLREQTRDKKQFAILFNENITYGFRRNLLGLKPVALPLNVIVLLITLLVICIKIPLLSYATALLPKMYVVLFIAVIHSTYLLAAVNAGSVREASRVYGRQLIISCEVFIGRSKSSSKKGLPSNAND